MTDELKPALTPEEWRNDGIDDPSILGDLRYVGDDQPDKMQKVVAVANDLLPDDSEYKITRADILDLESAASSLAREFGEDDEDALAAARIAAKLAALLPPEK